ncbi:MAG TPA: hypothetical protein VNU68_06695 [Verrucomicrobiae bacterium]|nr:hypothetical protein [Verrucomicrobiae bacterium]
MGLFRKKADPISERAKLLDDQIAALEAEIQRLSDRAAEDKPNGSPFVGSDSAPQPAQAATPSPTPATGPSPAQPVGPSPTPAAASASSQNQPRLRSTALPHHQSAAGAASSPTPPAPAAVQDPVFEEVPQTRWPGLVPDAESPPPAPELGVRRNDASSIWQRFKHNFRGPVTSNPKLVHYLSAGSIQGLRPLRYEKRVARNRVIVLAAFLVLALWGVIAIFISRR